MKLKVTKRVNPGWTAYNKMPKNIKKMIPNNLGKYQYIFSRGKKDNVSLIELIDYFGHGEHFWEIYSGGTLFEDVKRFDTKQEAIKYIKEVVFK